MNVPFLDLKSQYQKIKPEIHAVFEDILEHTAFISGKYVTQLETDFAEAHQARYFTALSSGTDAVHLMLWAGGIGPGDEVILPVNTFIATAEGISHCGATPVFVDNDPITYNMDVSKVEKKITVNTKAILPVHLYGQPAVMAPLKDLAAAHNLALYEDACQAHLASYRGIKIGNFGRAAAFSFYPGKNLGAYGEGGGILTNDESLHNEIELRKDHGSSQKYRHDLIGHNYRLEELQAGVLTVKLKYLESWNQRRREIAGLYRTLLADLDTIICPRESDDSVHVYHLFVVRVLDGRRESLQEFLKENGVGTGLHYPIPLHLQKAYAGLGYGQGDFPVAEEQTQQILSLPIYPEMEDDKVHHVTDCLRRYFHD